MMSAQLLGRTPVPLGQQEHQVERTVPPTLRQCKKFVDDAHQQYIEIRGADASGLPYSAKFWHGHLFWKLHGEEHLVTIGSDYVAQVSIETSAELENSTNIGQARAILMKRLKVNRVLLDQTQNQIAHFADLIKTQLKDIGAACATESKSVKCLLDVMRIAEKHSHKIGFTFCKDLTSSKLVYSTSLKVAFIMYAAAKNKLRSRSTFQRMAKWFTEWSKNNSFLRETLDEVLNQHKNVLLGRCLPSIKSLLENLEPRRCLLFRIADIKLFSDLECTLDDTICSTVLPVIVNNFIGRVAALKPAEFGVSLPLANEIYFYICKSLTEVVSSLQIALGIEEVVQYSENRWEIAASIKPQSVSVMVRCLVKQLEYLVEVANHFEPGKPTSRTNYPYQFQNKVLEGTESDNSGQHLWLCLMDITVMHIFESDVKHIEHFTEMLNMFYKCLTSSDSQSESQESFRMITHNTLEFVAQAEQSGFRCSEIDGEILKRQISFMNQSFSCGRFSFNQYRDAIDVFKDYRKLSNQLLPELPNKLRAIFLEDQIAELQKMILDIPFQVLQKKVDLKDATKFFRVYNELLLGLGDLSFEWYVRISNADIKTKLIERNDIQCVQNRLKETDNECYLVLNYDNFAQTCEAEGVPQHYQLNIVSSLLQVVINTLEKRRWKRGTNMLTDADQVNVSIHLINSVRSSLGYLKEQPEYIDFDKYSEESIKPFSSVLEESISPDNFAKRAALIKKSFWYIRNQRAIGINEALELFKQKNFNFNEGMLRTSFKLYSDHYEKLMRDFGDLDDDAKIEKIVMETRARISSQPCWEWRADFKTKTIPHMLAGLAAAWSILVSEDVSSSGHFLKPHTIQVISILRLLSVDSYSVGVENHLTEILTGQGKSVVLGLMAAVLALLGHDVVVVCYSKYLVSRDSKDFQELFERFSIDSKISYKTFESMPFEQIEPLSKKVKQYISQCIGIPYAGKGDAVNNKDLSNTVLLIDEVDVFFSDTFFGNTYDLGFFPPITGLGMVQQKIWELAEKRTENIEDVIKNYINTSDHPDVMQLKMLLDRPDSFKLIHKELDVCDVLDYTNESLFSLHFQRMIETAQDIYARKLDDDWIAEFRLNANGIITFKDDLGEYRGNYYNGYNNIFIYFKLQNTNFVQTINGFHNFGYLNLHLASFSAAKIPEKYPLILGVTGTLTGLIAYEKEIIENHYKILRTSIMPSFFGTSNLKYNRQTDFQCLPDEDNWRLAIFIKINEIVSAQRSVIVFFDEVSNINAFKKVFESKLDRLNELTINTETGSRERCIAESGFARTITLATSEMGRGVDYKSSLPVEQNGGVHVIQTFFLLDEKEETQIRGRTARKDNRGSYELIVCYPHLNELKLIDKDVGIDAINYNYLDSSRKKLTAELGQEKAAKLEKANALHEMSIQFCDGI